MGLPEKVEMRTVGPLIVYRSNDWRSGLPTLCIYSDDRGNSQDRAYLEKGAFENFILRFDTGATRTFRDEVHKHRKQIETLFILWR